MKLYSVMIVCLMTALSSLSYGQLSSDSVICFTITEAREINERVTLYPVLLDEIEALISKAVILEKKVNILQPQIAIKDEEIEQLTAALNESNARQTKLKKQRLWWGIGGMAAGIIIYGMVK